MIDLPAEILGKIFDHVVEDIKGHYYYGLLGGKVQSALVAYNKPRLDANVRVVCQTVDSSYRAAYKRSPINVWVTIGKHGDKNAGDPFDYSLSKVLGIPPLTRMRAVAVYLRIDDAPNYEDFHAASDRKGSTNQNPISLSGETNACQAPYRTI